MISFDDLRKANIARLPLFKNKHGVLVHSHPLGKDWLITEWTNAISNEAGEAGGFAKKLRRGDFGDEGSADYLYGQYLAALECADVVTYADITCLQLGYDLGYIVRAKFNEVSRRIGVDVTL